MQIGKEERALKILKKIYLLNCIHRRYKYPPFPVSTCMFSLLFKTSEYHCITHCSNTFYTAPFSLFYLSKLLPIEFITVEHFFLENFNGKAYYINSMVEILTLSQPCDAIQ